jgi:hypothetical protein
MALAIPGIVEKGGVIPMSAANAGTSAAGSPLLVEIVKVADRLRRTESLAVDTTLADVDKLQRLGGDSDQVTVPFL